MTTVEEWAKIDAEAATKMLADPIRWPQWPWLPMKRRGDSLEVGRVYADDTSPDEPVRLFKGALGASIETFPNHAALVAAGWIVD